MPSTTTFRRTLLISCLLLSIPGSGALAQSPDGYKVIYTGALYGYFGYPEVQDLKIADRCPGFSQDLLGIPESAFQSVLDRHDPHESVDPNKAKEQGPYPRIPIVRVAVGDNFAPYLLARQASNPRLHRLVPKEEYEYLPDLTFPGSQISHWVRVKNAAMNTVSDDTLDLYHGESDVPMDNVGCFIRLMHFKAIVPGKFDFYFGPERLRQLARFLKSRAASEADAFQPVRMLGANLSLNTRYVDPNSGPATTNNSGAGSSQSRPETSGVTPPSASLPQVVLPWVRSVHIKNALTLKATSIGANPIEEPDALALLKQAYFSDSEKRAFWQCFRGVDTSTNCRPYVGTVEGSANLGITGGSVTAEYKFTFALNYVAVCIDPNTTPSPKGAPTCAGSWAPLMPQTADDTKPPTTDLDFALLRGQFLQPNTACTGKFGSLVDGKCPKVPKSDNTYQLIIERKPAAPPSQKFAVQLPYLEDSSAFYRQAAKKNEKNMSYNEPWAPGDAPWVCDSSNKIAIFGVVDPSIGQPIGRLNDTWFSIRGDKPGAQFADTFREETDLQVSDPAEALGQVLQYFDEASDCKKAHRILLAQMAQPQAYELAARLAASHLEKPFELVIAQADPDRATGHRTLTRYLGPDEVAIPRPDGSSAATPENTGQRQEQFGMPVVLVPGFHYSSDDPYGIKVRLQVATISHGSAEGRPTQTICNNAEFSKSHCTVTGPCEVDPMQNDQLLGKISPAQDPAGTKQIIVASAPQSAANDAEHRSSMEQIIVTSAPHSAANDAVLPPLSPNPAAWKFNQWTAFFENLALVVMRQTCHSDVAFLQHRDVFLPSSYTQPGGQLFKVYPNRGIRTLMDIVFWKGDFIQCMNVPGSTISSLLQTSKQFQSQEDLGVTTQLSRGWALATLGVVDQNPQSQIINGQYLDPKKLYSVAITDFLANGDTGYPALQGAEPYPAARWDKIPVSSLSYEIIESILPSTRRPPPPTAAQILDTLLEDTSPVPKKPLQPEVTSWFQGLVPTKQQSKISDLDQTARDAPRWSLSLYQVNGSYSLFAHRDTLATVGQNFPGINQVNLSSPDSLSFAFDHLARLEWNHPTWLFFAQSELNYGAHNQRGKPPNEAYQPSQTADYYSPQAGLALRLLPRHQNPTSLTFQVPFELDTQLLKALTQYNIPCPATPPGCKPASGSPPPVYADHSEFYSIRPGFRYSFSFLRPQQPGQGQGGGQGGGQSGGQGGGSAQGQAGGQSGQGGGGGGAGQGGAKGQSSTLDSYFEFGFASGQVRNGPSAFEFKYTGTPPSGVTIPNPQTCYLVDLTACTGQLAFLMPQLIKVISGRDHVQQGLYFNFRVDMPLWHSTEGTLQNLGNSYFKEASDAIVDTRYYDDLKASLTVPIFRKISLAPTYEVIWFKNKLLNNTYMSQSTYVSLNYSFAWHSGLSWQKVLEGYSDPVPTLPPLPTR